MFWWQQSSELTVIPILLTRVDFISGHAKKLVSDRELEFELTLQDSISRVM